MEGVEAEGRTVNEATDAALEQLGLSRDQVDVEVLSQGRPRLLGFHGEPARVRVTPRRETVAAPPEPVARQPRRTEIRDEEPEDAEDDEDEEGEEDEDDGEGEEDGEEEDGEEEDEEEEYEDEDEEDELEDEIAEALPPELHRREVQAAVVPVPLNEEDAETAAGVLQELLNLMDVGATVSWREPETAGDGLGMMEAVMDVDGDDLGILIGRRGQTLIALQYLLNLLVSKKTNRRVSFGVDVDGYRRRREDTLVNLARRMASRVRGSGRSVTLEPMPPNERRIVHLALEDDPAVMTVSIGEGEERKVAITPMR